MLEGAANPAGAEAVVDWLLSDEVQAALPTSMYVFPVSDDVEVPADWARYADAAHRPLRGRARRHRRPPRAVAHRVDGRHQPVRRLAALAALALGPVLVLGVFFVLPVTGMVSPRASWSTAGSTSGAVLDVLARPRVLRVAWFTVWSSTVATVVAVAARDARGVRPAPARGARADGWSGRRCWCRSCCRPWWSAWRSASCSARAGRSGASASTARRSPSSPGWSSSTSRW